MLIAFGIVLANIVGLPIVKNVEWWKWMLLISLIFVSIQFVVILTLGTESPRWLLMHNKIDSARKAQGNGGLMNA